MLSFTIPMLVVGLSSTAPTYASDQVDSIAAAISGGDASIALRYRYEYVNQDDATGNTEANASTLKTRITYKTLPYKKLTGTLEFDSNSTIIEDGYNDTLGANPGNAVVADPTYSEINQAYLEYAAPAETTVRYGRQRITLDNQRFVGGVAWRQNEQTYDAISIINKSLPETTIQAAHLFNVNSIFGTNSGQGDQLINVNNKSIDGLSLTAYAYLIEDNTDTLGLRASGNIKLEEASLLYTAEYATQEVDNISETDIDYFNVEVGVQVSGITAKLGLESLGSEDNIGFSTPLGTKHKFNGWADKFLATPAGGLDDTYLSISSKELGPKVAVAFHQFDENEGSTDFGSEVDLVVTQKFDENYSGVLKLASYSEGDSGTGKTDTSKVWLQLLAKF